MGSYKCYLTGGFSNISIFWDCFKTVLRLFCCLNLFPFAKPAYCLRVLRYLIGRKNGLFFVSDPDMDSYSGLYDCIWGNVCKNMESPRNLQKCKNEKKGEGFFLKKIVLFTHVWLLLLFLSNCWSKNIIGNLYWLFALTFCLFSVAAYILVSYIGYSYKAIYDVIKWHLTWIRFRSPEMEGLWIVKAIQLKKKFLNIKPEVSAIEIGCHGWYIAILFLWPKRKNQLDAHLTYRCYSNLKSWVRKLSQTFLSLAFAIFKMLDGVDSLIQ